MPGRMKTWVEPNFIAAAGFGLLSLLLVLAFCLSFLYEAGQQDRLVSVLNAVAYVLAALLSEMMARGQERSQWRRHFWRFAVVLLAILAINELAGDLAERVHREWGASDYDDLVLWAITPLGLYLAATTERAPRFAVAMLWLGFAFQSVSNLIDLFEPELADLLGLSADRMLSITTISEFLFIETYLLGLLPLILFAVADPRAALWRRVELSVAPAERIHALHDFYVAHRLLDGDSLDTKHMIAILRCWPMFRIFWAVLALRRNGTATRALSGKGLWRQFAEQTSLAARHRIAPIWYYVFELHRTAHAERAADYVTRRETKAATYRFLRQRGAKDLADKFRFARACESVGVPIVPVLLAFDRGACILGTESGFVPPPSGLFAKPMRSRGGRGAERWDLLADGRLRRSTGETLSLADLLRRFRERSSDAGLIVQPRLVNHAAMRDLSNGALATVRLVTCRNEWNGVEAVGAALRMACGRNTVVDNFHAGGIAAAVELVTGTLGQATDLGTRPGPGWLDHHPDTGARITGRRLPLWDRTVEVAEAAHAAFAHRAIIGWDIAITDDGPLIVEANGAPDLDILQRVSRTPAGRTRLGELLANNLYEAARKLAP